MTTLTGETKTPIKNFFVVIMFTGFLYSIKSDISELRLKVEGKFNLIEYRLNIAEGPKSLPGTPPNSNVALATRGPVAPSDPRNYDDHD